jgi:hypothetical protein
MADSFLLVLFAGKVYASLAEASRSALKTAALSTGATFAAVAACSAQLLETEKWTA